MGPGKRVGNRSTIGVLAFLLVANGPGNALENLALDKYTCAEFLRDTTQPGNGGKILKSMMMISWATGYASGKHHNFARADAGAFILMASALGAACRKEPDQKAIEVIARLVQEASLGEPATLIAAPRANLVTKGAFMIYDNFDSPGADFRTLKNVDQAKCVAECASATSCYGYSFDKWNKWCFLKSGSNALRFDPSSLTAIKKNGAQPAISGTPLRIDRLPARKLVGSSRKIAAMSLDICEQTCASDEKCLGYTFVEKAQDCRALDDISSIAHDANSTSALKTQDLR